MAITGTPIASSPGSTEGLTFLNLVTRISTKRYDTISPDATQKTDCRLLCNDGYRQMLQGNYYDIEGKLRTHKWSFLAPDATLIAFKSVALDASVTVTASTVTVTASEASFHPGMIGHSLIITGDATYTITGYTSTTVVTIDSSSSASGATFSIDSERYAMLPATFGSIIDPFTYTQDTYQGRMREVTIAQISDIWAVSGTVTNDPFLFAIRPSGFSNSTGQRWEVIWNYYPGSDRILRYRYRVKWSNMSSDSELPLGGIDMNDAIFYGAMMKHEEDQGASRYYKGRFDEEMTKAVGLDKAGEARNLGQGWRMNQRLTRGFPTPGLTYTQGGSPPA